MVLIFTPRGGRAVEAVLPIDALVFTLYVKVNIPDILHRQHSLLNS
jgi:hypothetical protein